MQIFNSLRSRLITLLVGVVFLTATLTSVFGIFALHYDLQDKFNRDILEEIRREVTVLATKLIFDSREKNLTSIEAKELAQELRHEGDEYALRISDNKGQVLFSSQFFNHSEFALPKTAQAGVFTEARTDAGTTVHFFTLPIKNPDTDELYGMLQVGRAADQISIAISDELWIAGVGAAIATLFAILLGNFTAWRILAPIKKMTATAEEISLKNLKKRIHYRGPANDEMSALARTFDRMLDRLSENIKNLKQFTSDASHELRTPLTALSATIDVALAGENTSEYRRALVESQEQIRRMTMLVNDLLTLARADRGAWPIEKKPVNLTLLLKLIATELSPLAAEKRVLVSVKNLPEKLEILGDANKLKQLFLNLNANALKFNRPGGSVVITAKTTSNKVNISVADTGVGIEKSQLKKIFQRFYQVGSSHSTDGSGLGLSICEKIVSAHGGKLTVKSELDKGSVFTVILPKK